jgi:hypothetical protein
MGVPFSVLGFGYGLRAIAYCIWVVGWFSVSICGGGGIDMALVGQSGLVVYDRGLYVM